MASYTLKNIPDNLWYRVKIMAAMKNTTIRAFILDHLKKEVRKNFPGQH